MKKGLVLLLLVLLVGCSPKNPEFVVFDEELNTIEVNTEWEDPGAGLDMKTYWIVGDVVRNTLDTSTIGVYEIEYTAEYKGDMYTVKRTVEVVDTTSPEVFLYDGLDTIRVGEEWIDAGIGTSDNYDAYVEVVTTGEVDVNTPGTYIITYTAIDSSNNQTVRTREVIVTSE